MKIHATIVDYPLNLLLILLLSIGSISLQAATSQQDGFDQLWQQILNNSDAINARSSQLASAEVAFSRSKGHWLPKLYLQGGYTRTDSPIYSFMGNLAQRAVTPNDFVPSSLNNPDAKSFHQLNVNAVLPLYEGGVKVAINQALDHQRNQKRLERSATIVDLYSGLTKLYGLSLIAREEQSDLSAHLHELNRILSMYKVGSKNNPLGHSGLLGLQSLKARLVALQSANYALSSTAISSIGTLRGSTFSQSNLSPATLDDFIKQNLASSVKDSTFNGSFNVRALQEMAKAANLQKSAERARFLPQLSLFAQESFNHGDRDSENSYAVGLKLNWQLYNREDQGAEAQAALNAQAASYYSKAKLTQEQMQINRYQQELTAIRNGLTQLASIKSNLKKQVKITHRLFLNGVINVLQLTEVLSRYLDVTQQIKNTKKQYLDSSIGLYQLTSEPNDQQS
jgi:outer membrane protein TolC